MMSRGDRKDESPLLLKPRDAALLLQVSAGYLRDSDCPKILLPGLGRTAKPVIRYARDDLQGWARSRTVPSSRRSM